VVWDQVEFEIGFLGGQIWKQKARETPSPSKGNRMSEKDKHDAFGDQGEHSSH
jgi:hypothetical protein